MFGHPFGASEVTLVSPPRPLRLALGIDVQHDPSGLSPIRTFCIRVQQTKVSDCVSLSQGVRTESEGAVSATSGSSGSFCMGNLASFG
ncbi:hypothetical protein ABIC01_005579 [Bradyrhizobium sp. RT4b]